MKFLFVPGLQSYYFYSVYVKLELLVKMSRIVLAYLFGLFLVTTQTTATTLPTTPSITPTTTLAITPATTPTTTPETTPATIPITTPAATPVTTPATTPVTTPATTPVTTPVSTPVTPVTTPVTRPVTTPVTTPVITPVTTPATTPITTPATTPTTTPPIPTTTPTTATTLRISEQRSFTWTGSDVADGTTTNPIVFTVPAGYFISVTVSNVVMSDLNFLRIESGEVHQTDATEGLIFTNNVTGSYAFLFETNTVNAYCENSRHDSTDPILFDFSVKFEQTGEPTTTVSTTTTTTVSVPTTEAGDSLYITVNVNGRYLSEYEKAEIREAFQNCIVDIATSYCQEQNVTPLIPITAAYVMISNINACPYNWPDSTKCVQITFKLPIFHDGSVWTGSQISAEHLNIMWLRKDELGNQTCFRNNSFTDYNEPDIERSIVWWAVGISLVIAAFVILLWFLRTFSSKVRSAVKKREKRNSDSESIISRKTNSVSSLTPHYLQDHLDTPKFFD